MENFPENRATNINIRVSLGLKADLANEAANMGCTITDCVLHLITQGKTLKSRLEKLTIEHELLRAEAAQLKTTLHRFSQITEPLENQWVGQEVSINGQVVRINNKFQALELIFENFKTRKK